MLVIYRLYKKNNNPHDLCWFSYIYCLFLYLDYRNMVISCYFQGPILFVGFRESWNFRPSCLNHIAFWKFKQWRCWIVVGRLVCCLFLGDCTGWLSFILLAGGFKYVFFSSLFGEDSDFDYDFSIGLKPPRLVSVLVNQWWTWIVCCQHESFRWMLHVLVFFSMFCCLLVRGFDYKLCTIKTNSHTGSETRGKALVCVFSGKTAETH